MVFQKTRKLWVWCAMAFALVMFLGALADAQVAGFRPPRGRRSVFRCIGGTAMPSPTPGEFDLNLVQGLSVGYRIESKYSILKAVHVAWFLTVRGSSAEIVLSEHAQRAYPRRSPLTGQSDSSFMSNGF